MSSQPTTEMSERQNHKYFILVLWIAQWLLTLSPKSLPQFPCVRLSLTSSHELCWGLIPEVRGKSYKVVAQYWAQHRLLSLLCSQSYILGLRGQPSACCYQISYRKYMVRLGAAKGDKLTWGASTSHTALPTTAQTLFPHLALSLNTLPSSCLSLP